MINPPAANKYGYWVNERLPAAPDEWLEGARQHEGSWWTDWAKWLTPYRGKEVAPRIPGKGKLKVIEAAPGAYARIRADEK
jgi:polyhydroxyalkanoate synthase